MRRWTMVMGVLGGLALAGCSESTTAPAQGEQRLGPAGGTVQAGQSAVAEVPAGALAEETVIGVATVGVETLAARLPDALEPAGTPVAFTPHGTTFMQSVTLRIPASAAASAVMRLDDESDPSWETVEGARLLGNVAEVDVSGFSLYMAVQPASTGGGAQDASLTGPALDAGGFPECDPACGVGERCVYGICAVVCESGGGTGGSGTSGGPSFCESSLSECSDGKEYGISCEDDACLCEVDGVATDEVVGACGGFVGACGFDVLDGEPDLGVPHHCSDVACAPGEACIDGSCNAGCLGGGGNGGTGGSDGVTVCFRSFSDCTDGASLELECEQPGGCACRRNREVVAEPSLAQRCSASAEEIMQACGWSYQVLEDGGGAGGTTGSNTGSNTGSGSVGTSGTTTGG